MNDFDEYGNYGENNPPLPDAGDWMNGLASFQSEASRLQANADRARDAEWFEASEQSDDARTIWAGRALIAAVCAFTALLVWWLS